MVSIFHTKPSVKQSVDIWLENGGGYLLADHIARTAGFHPALKQTLQNKVLWNFLAALRLDEHQVAESMASAYQKMSGQSIAITLGLSGLAQLIGMESQKRKIFANVIFPNLNQREKAPHFVIFHGPPGSGKSEFGKRIAQEINYKIKIIKGADIIGNSGYGDSVKRVEQILESALNNAPCVLLLDECEGLMLNRDNAHEGNDAKQTANQLITMLDKIKEHNQTHTEKVIVVGTTNSIGKMDSAFISRAFIQEVPEADANTKVAIVLDAIQRIRKLRLADDMTMPELLATACQIPSIRQIKEVFLPGITNMADAYNDGILSREIVLDTANESLKAHGLPVLNDLPEGIVLPVENGQNLFPQIKPEDFKEKNFAQAFRLQAQVLKNQIPVTMPETFDIESEEELAETRPVREHLQYLESLMPIQPQQSIDEDSKRVENIYSQKQQALRTLVKVAISGASLAAVIALNAAHPIGFLGMFSIAPFQSFFSGITEYISNPQSSVSNLKSSIGQLLGKLKGTSSGTNIKFAGSGSSNQASRSGKVSTQLAGHQLAVQSDALLSPKERMIKTLETAQGLLSDALPKEVNDQIAANLQLDVSILMLEEALTQTDDVAEIAAITESINVFQHYQRYFKAIPVTARIMADVPTSALNELRQAIYKALQSNNVELQAWGEAQAKQLKVPQQNIDAMK